MLTCVFREALVLESLEDLLDQASNFVRDEHVEYAVFLHQSYSAQLLEQFFLVDLLRLILLNCDSRKRS